MHWVNSAYQKKEFAALAIQQPKLILAAGSSVHFGLNAEMIQKNFNIPTVNFGVMALLDLDYIFYRLQKVLKAKDSVILPLEYCLYGYDPGKSYSGQRTYQLLTFDQEFFRKNVPVIQQIRTIYGINPFIFLSSLYEQFRSKKINFQASGSYHVDKINQFGDETNANLHLYSPTPGLDMPPMTPDALTALKDFQQWCHKRNIQVYLTFPNVPYFKEYETPDTQKKMRHLVEMLKENGFNVIGTPLDAMVDPSLMFDTEYHLVPEGIKKRTNRFIEMLREINFSSMHAKRGAQ